MASLLRRPLGVGLIGFVVVLAYAVFAAVQILVLNPLAAVPGATLAEVYAELDLVGETIGVTGVLVFLACGPLLAAIVVVTSLRSGASRRSVAIGICVILALGAPAYFFASFGPGMSLADGFAIGGGDHSRWSLVLYAVSILALATAITIGLIRPRRAVAPVA